MRRLFDQPPCHEVIGSVSAARIARRRLLKTAVSGERGSGPQSRSAGTVPLALGSTRTLIGTILDVSPQVLILTSGRDEVRLTLAATATAWRGRAVPPAALHHGDRAIVRRIDAGASAADRIWAGIGRVTGTIVERDGRVLLVDDGTGRGRKVAVIPASAAAVIEVRFPRLLPGYLIDVIGLRRQGFLEALVPATSQPPYRADRPPRPRVLGGRLPESISGTAVWHDDPEEPEGVLGVSYPALDPQACGRAPCTDHARPASVGAEGDAQEEPGSDADLEAVDRYAVDPHTVGSGCVRLPYLSVGSLLTVRNDCASRTRVLPVTGCGAVARLFCDRCVACGTSPRGRIADLTAAAFVDLGGDLAAGCFNATIAVGGGL